jgi:hypothetical protein
MTALKPYLKRRKRSYMDRPVDHLPIKQRYLIVCEGERTEPNYFRCFHISPDSVVDVRGEGANTESLICKAIELRDHDREQGVIYDQIWCVFDRDSFPAENFKAAFILARQNNIQIAYSNEAFELWYVLHFQYLDTGITRVDYIHLLDNHLSHPYEKKSPQMYAELLPFQKRAIQNAKTLYNQYHPKNPERDKPSTTVHQLVEKLNELDWQSRKDVA